VFGEEAFEFFGYPFGAALVKDENRRARATEGTPEKTVFTKREHFSEAGNERRAVGLVQFVLQGGGKGIGVASAERGNEKSRVLHVEDGVPAGITVRENGARFGSGEHEVGNNGGHAVTGGKLDADGMNSAIGLDGGGDDGSGCPSMRAAWLRIW
jgi:hypothetical protein